MAKKDREVYGIRLMYSSMDKLSAAFSHYSLVVNQQRSVQYRRQFVWKQGLYLQLCSMLLGLTLVWSLHGFTPTYLAI